MLAPTGKEQARQTKDVQIANLKARVSELEEEVRDAEAAKLALEAELASYRLAAVSVPVTVDAEAKAS